MISRVKHLKHVYCILMQNTEMNVSIPAWQEVPDFECLHQKLPLWCLSHFPWVFRLLAMSLWDLHVSSIHAGTDPNIVTALPLFHLLCLFTAASQHLYECQPQSHPQFSLLCATYTTFLLSFSHTPLFTTSLTICDSCLLFEPLRFFIILLAFISCLNYLGNYFSLEGHW